MENQEGQVDESNAEVSTETAQAATEKTQAEGSTETAQQDNDKEDQVDITKVDVEKLAPEVKAAIKSFQADYTRKTQALAEERKRFQGMEQYKQAVDALVNDPEFVKWYQSRNQQPKQELTDDEYQAALLDRTKFAELVRKQAESIVESKFGPKVNSLQEALVTQQLNSELDMLEKKYPDFKEINKLGGMDQYVHAGHNFETAYALYKLHNGKQEIDKKAAEVANGIVQKKKLSSVEKPGGSVPTGKKVVKARSFNEAFDKAFEAASNNEEVLVERA